jgi:hypothetical protein
MRSIFTLSHQTELKARHGQNNDAFKELDVSLVSSKEKVDTYDVGQVSSSGRIIFTMLLRRQLFKRQWEKWFFSNRN